MISHSPVKAHIVAIVLLVLCAACGEHPAASNAVAFAFDGHQSNIAIEDEGMVERILPDDTSGLPHQRFIVRLTSGGTVLVEHNIDVARRIDGLKSGDPVRFAGEYIWNPQGGLIH